MPTNPHAQAYAELKGLLAQQGLFDRQPRYYTWKILQMLSCLGLALGILLTTQLFWLQMLNAAFLACVFTQVAFLGQDAAYRQIFQSSWKTDVFCLLCPLVTAISYSWWTDKHDRHHRYPNHLERDPDVQLRFLAFADEQRHPTQSLRLFIVKHQAWLFSPLLLLARLRHTYPRRRLFALQQGEASRSRAIVHGHSLRSLPGMRVLVPRVVGGDGLHARASDVVRIVYGVGLCAHS